jgi:hypothetical protein
MPSTINASTTSGIIQTADTSGILNLQASNTTIASVSSTGVAVTGNISATGTVAGSTGTVYPLVSRTAIASTSGTSIDFTGIPSWVERITVILNGVSTTGASNIELQLGTSTQVEITGYLGVGSKLGATTVSTGAIDTNGFSVDTAATDAHSGTYTLTNPIGNTWVCVASISRGTAINWVVNGTKTLTTGVLDRIRLTTSTGTPTFDAGSINILYE